MAGRIQDADLKTAAEAGGIANCPKDTKIYVTASSLNKSLKDAIEAGDLGGGGGGGGSLQWFEDPATLAPMMQVNNSMREWLFGSGESQYRYALIKVPNSYVAGKQVKMRMDYRSPDTSGNVLIQSLTTLRRNTANTGDAVSSTTNQRTSTNAAVTMSGANNNKPLSVVLDLTDATGNVNSVAIAANDLLLVRLQRGTDTATSELYAMCDTAEVTFNG